MIRWLLKMPVRDIQVAEIFSTILAYVVADRPRPPNSSGMVAPKRPSSFIWPTISWG